MKAGLVANLAAIRAVRAAGIRLERPAALHFVVGEEDGGLGAFATLDRGHHADACVITEPTSGTLVTATAGALTFELTVVAQPPTPARRTPARARCGTSSPCWPRSRTSSAAATRPWTA